MATLEDAKALLAWMRAEGLRHARVGELELALDEPAAPDDMDEDGPEWERPRPFREIEEDPELYGDEHETVPTMDPLPEDTTS